MKLAAIDIGSNAARLYIGRVLTSHGTTTLKRIEYLRFPLKLGKDVFRHQKISDKSKNKLTQLLQAFKLLIDLYKVEDYMICATSALREAKNQPEIINHIHKQLGLTINIIDGQEEAALIDKAMQPLLEQHNYLHVDVGGGSTEVSLYTGHQKTSMHSFEIGTIKLLEGCDVTAHWQQMKTWIKEQASQTPTPLLGIATGGNIRKLAQIAGHNNSKPLPLQELKATHDYLSKYSLEERINTLALNPDRADVILPAAEIYIATMTWGGVKKIFVPEVSLRDGILQAVYERNADRLNT